MTVSDNVLFSGASRVSGSLVVTSLLVIVIHCCVVAWMWLGSTAFHDYPRPVVKRLAVQTITLQPKVEAAKAVVATAPAEKQFSKPSQEIAFEIPASEETQEVQVVEVIKPEIQAPPSPEAPPAIQEPKPELKQQETPKAKADVKKAVAPAKKEVVKKSVPKKAKATVDAPVKKAEAPKAKSPVKKPEIQKQTAPPKPQPAKAKEQSSAAEAAALEKQKKLDAEQKKMKAQQDKWLLQAKETIAKIDQTRDKFGSNQIADNMAVALPGGVSSLQIDGIENKSMPKIGDYEESYRSELASRLKLRLKLPEYGDVNIKLTLDRSGKVVSVAIASAESAANRKYIEKTVPTLTFPGFGSHFGSAAQFTFSITLSNDL